MLRAATKSGEDTKELAGAVASLARSGDVVLLAGDLGAGKTTFTQGFGRALGVDAPITSPTFTLLNHYATAGGLTLLHADVYRLDRLQEIVDLGLTELVDDAAIALVEWGDVAEPVLPKDFLEIRIAYPEGDAEDDHRTFTFRPVGVAWGARIKALSTLLERWSTEGSP